MTRTETALRGLDALLKAAFPLPGMIEVTPTRNEDVAVALEAVAEGGPYAGINLRDGAAEISGQMLGVGNPLFEMTHRAEIEWMVADPDAEKRDAAFDDGLMALAAVILASPDLGTDFIADAHISDIERSGLVTDGAAQVKAAVLVVTFTFSSPTPF
jgi:hypothetical protein